MYVDKRGKKEDLSYWEEQKKQNNIDFRFLMLWTNPPYVQKENKEPLHKIFG